MTDTEEAKVLELFRERTQIQRAIRDGCTRVEEIEAEIKQLTKEMPPASGARL